MNAHRLVKWSARSIVTLGFLPSAGLLSAAACFLFLPAMAFAQSNCGKPPNPVSINGSLDQPHFPPIDAPPFVALPAETTPLAIQITSPASGAVTRRNQIEVKGTFDGPPNTGITINGNTAFADDVAKTNLSAILHQHGLETVRSL